MNETPSPHTFLKWKTGDLCLTIIVTSCIWHSEIFAVFMQQLTTTKSSLFFLHNHLCPFSHWQTCKTPWMPSRETTKLCTFILINHFCISCLSMTDDSKQIQNCVFRWHSVKMSYELLHFKHTLCFNSYWSSELKETSSCRVLIATLQSKVSALMTNTIHLLTCSDHF